jgi:hypothetical protein
MLFAIVAIWAVVIPVGLLAISWGAPDPREPQTDESVSTLEPPTAAPSLVHRAVRPGRTTVRRRCPELAREARRRPTSA